MCLASIVYFTSKNNLIIFIYLLELGLIDQNMGKRHGSLIQGPPTDCVTLIPFYRDFVGVSFPHLGKDRREVLPLIIYMALGKYSTQSNGDNSTTCFIALVSLG